MQRYEPGARWGLDGVIPYMKEDDDGEYVKVIDVIEKLKYFGDDIIHCDKFIELLNELRTLM